MRPETDAAEPQAYAFDADHGQHAGELVELLGGKGAGLALMTAMGLPVPPGFTFTTGSCREYLRRGWTDEHEATLRAGLAELEHRTGKRLGDRSAPLLVSVRSGASASMPGMLATVLDVGMTDEVAHGLHRWSGDERFAADTQRRALLSHAVAVAGVPPDRLRTPGRSGDIATVRRELADLGVPALGPPTAQVAAAVRAVFESWGSADAVRYRELTGIVDAGTTAATVQAMVYGNLGADSGTGVVFSRDPSTGAPGPVGDLLAGAQGADVVDGRHDPRPISEMAERWPDAWTRLCAITTQLEREFADMVDIEFTVERGLLWVLQARRAKRGPVAALRVAIDMADDADFPLDRAGAVRRCRAHLDQPPSVHAAVDAADDAVLVCGHPAAPGCAVGALCLDVDRTLDLAAAGVDVVLVRPETSPADVQGMDAAVALVTTLGGPMSHAAVVARSWGKPAVVGASDLAIVDGAIEAGGRRVVEGEMVTVDGDRGRLLLGAHAGGASDVPELETIRRWAAEMESDR